MSMGFGHPASWALGLGVLAGAIAGTVVPSQTPAEELRHVFGFVLIFGPAIYALITRRDEYWTSKHPYLRFIVFTVSMMTATVLLVQLVVLLLGDFGVVARAVEFLAAVAGFVVAAWMTFYGGAEAVWDEFLERTDTNW